MKAKIKEGIVSRIIPACGGGLTGEVHLLKYDDESFILRRCDSLEKAKRYQKVYKKFEKFGFLPKLIGRYGKDVVFEHIKGNHPKEKDSLKIFYEMGKMAAQINQFSTKYDYKKVFENQLKEIATGEYKLETKVRERRRRNKEDIRPKKVFSGKEVGKIKEVYNYLERKCRPKTSWDANDYAISNFIITPEKKVYFVDIEAIKPKIKGFGIAKAMTHLVKSKNQKKKFMEGYSSVASVDFLSKEYRDFLDLSFLMQKINYRFKIYRSSEYKVPVMNLRKIVRSYRDKI